MEEGSYLSDRNSRVSTGREETVAYEEETVTERRR